MRLQGLVLLGSAVAAAPLYAQAAPPGRVDRAPIHTRPIKDRPPPPPNSAVEIEDLLERASARLDSRPGQDFSSSATGLLTLAGDASPGHELLAAGHLEGPRTVGEAIGDLVDLTALGAVGDAFSWPDGTVVAGTNTLSSQSASFSACDAGGGTCTNPAKLICLTGSGTGSVSVGPQGTAITQCGSITSVTNSHTVTVSFTPANPPPSVGIATATVVDPGAGYAPGDIVDIDAPSATAAAAQKVWDTQVVSATVSNAGTGISVAGPTCGVVGTTGNVRNKTSAGYFEASVTTSNGTMGSVSSIVYGGDYALDASNPSMSNPQNPDPVIADSNSSTPCTGLVLASGGSLAPTVGVLDTLPYAYGAYPKADAPDGTYPTTSVSGSGSSLTLQVSGDFPVSGIVTWGTDDSLAYKAAVDLVNSGRALGYNTLLYVPPGECSNGTTTCSGTQTGSYFFGNGVGSDPFTNGGGIVTDGNYATTFYMSPMYVGSAEAYAIQPLIWWFSKGSNAPAFDAPSLAFSQQLGPSLTGGILVTGDRTAKATQVGMALCGNNYFAEIHDYQFRNLPGTGLELGCTTSTVGSVTGFSLSHNRESRFYNIRGFNSGNFSPNGSGPPTEYPAIDINTQNFGSGSSTQTAGGGGFGFNNIELFGTHGTGILIHSAHTGGDIDYVDFTGKIRVEGLSPDGTPIQGPLIQVGDTNTALDGQVHDISFPAGMQLKDPYFGSAAFLVTWSGTDKQNIPYNITTGPGTVVSGGAPYGNGFDIEACTNCDFYILQDYVLGTAYSQGAASRTGTVTLHLQPGEAASWVTNIDPTAEISQSATILSTGGIGPTGAIQYPVAETINFGQGGVSTAGPIQPTTGTFTASVNMETGTYFALGPLTCIDMTANLDFSSVSGTGTGTLNAVQFELPVKPALNTHDTIAVTTINGTNSAMQQAPIAWPAPSSQTTQIRFAPLANQAEGQIEFQGSALNTPSLSTNLNVSNLTTNTAYTFIINGCYQ